MRFKTLAAVFTVAALTLATSSCGGTDNGGSDTATDIDFLYPTNNPGFKESIPATLGPEFTTKSGVTVRLLDAATTYEEVDQRLQSDLLAGDPPDIVAVGLNSVRTYVDAGLAQPLDELINDDQNFKLDDLYESYLSAGTIDNKTYAIPYTTTLLVMYYNADVFQKAGLDPDSPPKTFSELRSAAQRIVESGAARTGVMWRTDHTSMFPLQSYVFSNDGAFTNADETRATFTDPKVEDIVDYWADMQSKSLSEAATADRVEDAFARGDVGIMLNSASALESTKKTAGFPLRTAIIPVPDGGQLRNAALGTALIITAKDKPSQQAAWVALRELVSPQGSTAITKASGYLPVNRVAVETPDLLGEFLSTDTLRKPIFDQVPDAVPTYQFPGNHAVEIWDILTNAVVAATRGDKDVQTALSEAQDAADRLMP